MRRLLLSFCVIAAHGCKDETDDTAAAVSVSAEARDDWSSRLREPDIDALLAALAQPHRVVRESMGPHQLAYEAAIGLEPTSEREDSPGVNDKVVVGHAVKDTLSLTWAGTDETGPRFSLQQSNDQERGRDVVVVQGQLYSRLRHRGWTVFPLETTVHELWLDDAQHAVFDAVEFAAPGLAISSEVRPGAGLRDADAVAITLSAADTVDANRLRGGDPSDWRSAAVLEQISGEVLLDINTGAWLSADVDVRYSLQGGDGRPLRGSVTVKATVVAQGDAASVSPPTGVTPLPERARYDLERQRLLDGLAAP